MDLGQRVHHVEDGGEARYFHEHPGDAAGDIEAAFHRGFAHAVPRDEELHNGDLDRSAVQRVRKR